MRAYMLLMSPHTETVPSRLCSSDSCLLRWADHLPPSAFCPRTSPILSPLILLQFSSVQSLSRVWLRPHGLQHARTPRPTPTPRVYPNSCPLSWWCHPTISSSVAPFSSCPQSFSALGYFPMSQLFTSRSQTKFLSSTGLCSLPSLPGFLLPQVWIAGSFFCFGPQPGCLSLKKPLKLALSHHPNFFLLNIDFYLKSHVYLSDYRALACMKYTVSFTRTRALSLLFINIFPAS